MGILDLYSKRLKRATREQNDVVQYDVLPERFRVQVRYILLETIGPYWQQSDYGDETMGPNYEWWDRIHDGLAREYGRLQLSKSSGFHGCMDFLMSAPTIEALDFIEVAFAVVKTLGYQNWVTKLHADAPFEELNARFMENDLGYVLENKKLKRVDSKYLHAETVKPALALLNDEGFEGPIEEFQQAHEHHRHGKSKDAIAWALKAFESTLKSICKRHSWSFPANATSKALLDIVAENNLFPESLLSQATALRSILESGVPTVRNTSTSSHGQGVSPVQVPQHFAAFALHLTASNIVFLVEAHKALLKTKNRS